MIGWLLHHPVVLAAAIATLLTLLGMELIVGRSGWGRDRLEFTRRGAIRIGTIVGLCLATLALAWHFTVEGLRDERDRAIHEDTLQRADVKAIARTQAELAKPTAAELDRRIQAGLRECLHRPNCLRLFRQVASRARPASVLLAELQRLGARQTAPSPRRQGPTGKPPRRGRTPPATGTPPPTTSPPAPPPPPPPPPRPPRPPIPLPTLPTPPRPTLPLPGPVCNLIRPLVPCTLPRRR